MMVRKRSILYLTNKGLQLDLSAHALSKLFARYEIFKMVLNLPGDIVERLLHERQVALHAVAIRCEIG